MKISDKERLKKIIKTWDSLQKQMEEHQITRELLLGQIEEQAKLRAEYIRRFRQGMENTLSNVYIVDEKGNKKKVEKKTKTHLN